MKRNILSFLAFISLISKFGTAALCLDPEVIHEFTKSDGVAPCALVLGRDGKLYGTTFSGGSDDHGTVFRLSTDGVLTTLASFPGHDAAYPFSAVVFGADRNLYGATAGGGRGGGGTIFRLTLPKIESVRRTSAGAFVIAGNGPANDSYQLWGAAELSQPAFWTPVASGFFDSSGSFSFTDSSINQARFYMLSTPQSAFVNHKNRVKTRPVAAFPEQEK